MYISLNNKRVSAFFGVSQVTVRKWCMFLEKNGYEFKRGLKDSRAFTFKDLYALAEFHHFTSSEKMTGESAGKIVADKYKEIKLVTTDQGEADLSDLHQKIDYLTQKVISLAEIIEQSKKP